MKNIIDILLLAMITIYAVDLSGFTDAWREALKRALKINSLRQLPPFDCGQCMVWWVCLIYALCVGAFNLGTIAYIALLAFLSYPLGQLLLFIREALSSVISKLIEKVS